MFNLRQTPTRPTVEQKEISQSVKVLVRSVYWARYAYQGMHTKYVFNPGEVQEVEPEDVPGLLSLVTSGGGCCGATTPGGQPYFEKVEG